MSKVTICIKVVDGDGKRLFQCALCARPIEHYFRLAAFVDGTSEEVCGGCCDEHEPLLAKMIVRELEKRIEWLEGERKREVGGFPDELDV